MFTFKAHKTSNIMDNIYILTVLRKTYTRLQTHKINC